LDLELSVCHINADHSTKLICGLLIALVALYYYTPVLVGSCSARGKSLDRKSVHPYAYLEGRLHTRRVRSWSTAFSLGLLAVCCIYVAFNKFRREISSFEESTRGVSSTHSVSRRGNNACFFLKAFPVQQVHNKIRSQHPQQQQPNTMESRGSMPPYWKDC
jgi:hypothetical protein